MILPNQLTVLRIILTPVFVFFFLGDGYFFKEISLVVFIIASLTDWYDGWLARKFNYFTKWGKIWDPIADKILTSAALFCFFFAEKNALIPLWMIIIIIFRDVFMTALRGYAEYVHKPFPTSTYAKWKTFIEMFFIFYVLTFYCLSLSNLLPQIVKNFSSALIESNIVYWFAFFVTAITLHSGLLYLLQNRHLLKELIKK